MAMVTSLAAITYINTTNDTAIMLTCIQGSRHTQHSKICYLQSCKNHSNTMVSQEKQPHVSFNTFFLYDALKFISWYTYFKFKIFLQMIPCPGYIVWN